MADLAALGRPNAAGFPDAVRREIVVEQKRIAAFAFDCVDDLGIAFGAQRGYHQRLSFPAGEQGRAVRPRQYADADADGTDRGLVAAVDAATFIQRHLPHQLVFQILDGDGHVRRGKYRVFFRAQGRNNLIAQGRERVAALQLVDDAVGFRDPAGVGVDRRNQCVVRRRRLPVPGGGSAGFLDQLLDRLDGDLQLLVAMKHRTQHHNLRQFLGFRFHHKHRGFGAGHHEIQFGIFQILETGIKQILTVGITDARRTDRAVERYPRYRQRRGGTNHRRHIRVHLGIQRQHRGDDLHFVLEAFRKQRPQRPVDQAAGERLLFAGTAFTFEKAAGDLAGGVGAFLIIDSKGEEIAVRRLLVADDRHHHDCLPHADDYRAGRLSGDLAGFECDRMRAVLK